MWIYKKKEFLNGVVYALRTEDGYPVETTDSFLPLYTKDCIGRHQNALVDYRIASRAERWMVGVSCMSGCPVHCKFCATGMLPRYRPLTAEEIIAQVDIILKANPGWNPANADEFKVNYTRMGEPFLNIDAVRAAVEHLDRRFPNTHHYISTIGIEGSDFSWIKDNITLQFSVHSLDRKRRDDLIPYSYKMSLEEMGQVRTNSKLKTSLNLCLVGAEDFDIDVLRGLFDPKYFFIKLSPINPNPISEKNKMGEGIIGGVNLY